MTDNKTSEAQLRANREYRKRINDDEEKKKHRNYMTSKRTAKSFINSKATLEDIEELEQLIEVRKKALSE